MILPLTDDQIDLILLSAATSVNKIALRKTNLIKIMRKAVDTKYEKVANALYTIGIVAIKKVSGAIDYA